jgi:hypothetical protein
MATLNIFGSDDHAKRQVIDVVFVGTTVRLVAEPEFAGNYEYRWNVPPGVVKYDDVGGHEIFALFPEVGDGRYTINVTLYHRREDRGMEVAEEADATLRVLPRSSLSVVNGRVVMPGSRGATEHQAPFLGTVALRRTNVELTSDVALWLIIRYATESLSFSNYQRYMDFLLCHKDVPPADGKALGNDIFNGLLDERFLPFNDTDAYRYLKVATEAFLMASSGVNLVDAKVIDDLVLRLGTRGDPNQLWQDYLRLANGTEVTTLPYLDIIRRKLADLPIKQDAFAALRQRRHGLGFPEDCNGILREKLTRPLFIELIWSYWHEEGMLVQSLNAISRRFQNVRAPGANDPLAAVDRVDAMKTIQGWSDTSVMHFHNLAVFGEQVLLSIRYGAWTRTEVLPLQAANWARYWRAEIQGYIHAYRAVTGIDLSADIADNQRDSERYTAPSAHLQRQLDAQRQGRRLPAPTGGGRVVARRKEPAR